MSPPLALRKILIIHQVENVLNRPGEIGLTLILTPRFSSPVLEENAVGLRKDTVTCTAASSQLLNQKFKSINLNPSPILLSKQFGDSSRH